MSEDANSETTTDTQMTERRRGYLKWLIALAIGIPLALEAGTIWGLLQGHSEESGVSVGDDLLPDTPHEETIEVLAVTDGTFELAVDVRNTESSPYSVSIAAVRLSNEETLDGDVSVGPIATGERETLTGSWALPSDTTPTAIEVVAREHVDGESRVLVADTVELSLST